MKILVFKIEHSIYKKAFTIAIFIATFLCSIQMQAAQVTWGAGTRSATIVPATDTVTITGAVLCNGGNTTSNNTYNDAQSALVIYGRVIANSLLSVMGSHTGNGDERLLIIRNGGVLIINDSARLSQCYIEKGGELIINGRVVRKPCGYENYRDDFRNYGKMTIQGNGIFYMPYNEVHNFPTTYNRFINGGLLEIRNNGIFWFSYDGRFYQATQPNDTGITRIYNRGLLIKARSTRNTPYNLAASDTNRIVAPTGSYNSQATSTTSHVCNGFSTNSLGILELYDSAYVNINCFYNGGGSTGDADCQQSGSSVTISGGYAKGIVEIHNKARFDIWGNFANAYGKASCGNYSTGILSVYDSAVVKIGLAEYSRVDFPNGYGPNSMGVVNLYGGDLDIRGSIQNGANGSGTGIFNIYAGHCVFESPFLNGQVGNAACTGILNVDGGELIMYESFSNAYLPQPNSQINVINGGILTCYKNVVSVGWTGSSPATSPATNTNANTQFTVRGGKIVMAVNPTDVVGTTTSTLQLGANGSGHDRQIVIRDTSFTDTNGVPHYYQGGLIVDKNKTVYITSNPLTLDANTAATPTHTDFLAPYQLNVNSINVKAALAVLSNGTLRFSDANDRAIINNKAIPDNLYFHRGTYGNSSDQPGKVYYNKDISIMPVTATNPYGILQIGNNYGGSATTNVYTNSPSGQPWLPDTLYIGGESDLAFDWQKTNATYSNYGNLTNPKNILLVGTHTNLKRTDDKEIVGNVIRRNTITGVEAIISDWEYCFNNRYTTFNFGYGDLLSEFGLRILPDTYPSVGGIAIVSDTYAKRKVNVDFKKKPLAGATNPIIQNYSIGYVK